jgi:hypothetical protein
MTTREDYQQYRDVPLHFTTDDYFSTGRPPLKERDLNGYDSVRVDVIQGLHGEDFTGALEIWHTQANLKDERLDAAYNYCITLSIVGCPPDKFIAYIVDRKLFFKHEHDYERNNLPTSSHR